MVEIEPHQFEDKVVSGGSANMQEPDPIRKAFWLSNKFKDFAKFLELSADNGVLITSLDDGPIEAMMLIEQIKSEKCVDNLVPAYVSNEYKGIDGSLNYFPSNNFFPPNSKPPKDTAGISVFYEGHDGQPLLTAIESLIEVNGREQVSMNGHINMGNLSHLNDTIGLIGGNLNLKLGYVYEKSDWRIHANNFIFSLMNVQKVREKEEKVASYFSKFLKDDNFNSPLRATEQVRACIFGIVQSYDEEGILLPRTKLDEVLNGKIYNKIAKEFDERLGKSWLGWKENRKRITDILITQLEDERLIDSSGGYLVKGVDWVKFDTKFINAYTKFYGDLVYE